MPPAVGVIVSIGAAIGAAFVKSAIVSALITIAANIAVGLLTKKPKNTSKLNQGSELRTKIDPTMTRQVMVGPIATGGSCHFVYTGTNDNSKPNRFLYRVIQLSDMPIHALTAVKDGDNNLTFAGDITTGWYACNQYRAKNGAACMWMRVYLGSYTAVADATLVAETGGVWTNNHKGTGLAYVIVKMDSDPDAFPNGEPSYTFEMQGAHLYDDRKDSTKPGGSGPHRLNDYDTWEYSDTASIITAQFLRGFNNSGVRIVGVGAEERDLPTSMLISAHNTCEQAVSISAGSEKRYSASMTMSSSDQADNILEDLQAAMDGRIFDRGGAITILPGAIRTPVMSLTDQDIVWTEEKSWQPKASLESMLNCVTGNYIDAQKNYQEADLPILKNPQWEIDDGGERFTTFFSFRAITRRTQGERITKRIHEASRYTGVAAFTGGLWLLEMEQGDWFTLSSARWGFSNKYFEIQEITITKDLRVAVIARETSPNIDNWDHSVDETPRTDTQWSAPDYDIPVPDIFAESYTTQEANTGIQTFNIDAGLTTPGAYGGYIKQADFEIRVQGDAEASAAASIRVDQQKTTITGLTPATTYEVRGRLSDGTRTGEWTAWEEVEVVPGVRIVAGQIDVLPPGGGPPQPLDDFLEAIDLDLEDLSEEVGNIHTSLDAQAVLNAAVGASLNQLDRDTDIISDTLLRAIAISHDIQQNMTDAGIIVDPATGKVSIYGLSVQGERITKAEIGLDGVNAKINLKAEYTYVDQAIATAVLDPSQIAELDEIFVRLSAAEIDIDALQASIILKADVTTVTALTATVTSLSTSLDALTGTVSTKASQTEVNALSSRVTSVETTLGNLDAAGAVGVATEVRQMRVRNNLTDDALLRAVLTGDTSYRGAVTQMAVARQELYTKINDDVSAEAGARLALAVRVGAAEAGLVSEQTVRATADTAMASDITTLNAQMGSANAAIAAETSARVAADSVFTGQISSLNASLGTTNANVASETAARISADNTLATTLTSLSTTVDGHTATLTTYGASINAMQLQWGTEFNVGGRVTGFKLLGSATRTDAIFEVDNFYVGSAAAGNMAPFVVSGGTTYIKKAVIKDADIDTLKIAGQAVTRRVALEGSPSMFYNSSPTSAGAIVDQTFTPVSYTLDLPYDSVVILQISAFQEFSFISTGGAGNIKAGIGDYFNWAMRLRVDGTLIRDWGTAGDVSTMPSITKALSMSAGTHTIAAEWFRHTDKMRLIVMSMVIDAAMR